jgi:hypothetical protein
MLMSLLTHYIADWGTVCANLAAPPPPPLANGTYYIALGSNMVDAEYGHRGTVPPVQFWPTNTDTSSQWAWNGSTFSNGRISAEPGLAAGPYMADNGDGTVTENATGDAWTVNASGSGYTVRNKRTGQYLSVVSNAVAMSSTQTVWTMTAVPPPSPTAITLSSTNPMIADNAPAGSLLAIATVTMSDGSQFAGILTTSDTNFLAISGLNIVTARKFSAADDGTHSTVITAS